MQLFLHVEISLSIGVFFVKLFLTVQLRKQRWSPYMVELILDGEKRNLQLRRYRAYLLVWKSAEQIRFLCEGTNNQRANSEA